jgi:hypothetical protein
LNRNLNKGCFLVFVAALPVITAQAGPRDRAGTAEVRRSTAQRVVTGVLIILIVGHRVAGGRSYSARPPTGSA